MDTMRKLQALQRLSATLSRKIGEMRTDPLGSKFALADVEKATIFLADLAMGLGDDDV